MAESSAAPLTPPPSAPAVAKQSPQQVVEALCRELDADAIERDRAGGVPLRARQWIRGHGLLALSAPRHTGGSGCSWSELSPLMRQIARVDSSVAHLLTYHYLGLTIPLIFADADTADGHFRRTVAEQLFWCNALNPRDRRTSLRAVGNGFRLHGLKSFCSGSLDSDMIPTTAVLEDTGELVIILLPTRTQGVELLDDWNNIGQRQTSSGTIRFEQVAVSGEQILHPSRRGSSPFTTMRTLLAQQNLANLYLGLAEGALEQALALVRQRIQSPQAGGAAAVDAVATVLGRDRFAQLWIQLQAADAHYQRSLELLEAAWRQGPALTSEQRGAAAIAIATTKVLATEAALAISSAIFDRLGARFTDASYGLDRYWRNIRTLSLHDSAEIKLQEIGEYVLEGRFPVPGFYS